MSPRSQPRFCLGGKKSLPDYKFGSALTRYLCQGVSLSNAEQVILNGLIEDLPEHLKPTVISQFEAYNLVQREVDGRALNFYRIWPIPIISVLRPVPNLPSISAEEAVLIKGKFESLKDGKAVHATMHAVGTRTFCVSRDRSVDTDEEVALVSTKNSWLSSYPASASA